MPLLEHALLDWNEEGQPFSRLFGDVYFSRHNGLAETCYVFIEHNHLEQRFQQITQSSPTFTIGETGFGTGLNFLCALQTFLTHAPAYAQLHFISTEKHPLKKDDLDKALSLWPELAEHKQTLLAQYPPLFPGFYSLSFANHRVRLTLLLGDATEQLSSLIEGHVDAWFLDGFAPNKNPDLWNESLLKQIARLSKKGTTFSTFTAASNVNKTLTELGFKVEKVAGFAQKREMLCGQWLHENLPSIVKPWFRFQAPAFTHKKAVIIGAGLAGATTAWSLANRGWQVTLIEKNKTIAEESSGNLQGVVYARLSAFNNAPNKLIAQAYQHSLGLLNNLYPQAQPDTWSPCGVLQLTFNEKEQKRYNELVESQNYPADILQPVTKQVASTLAGITISQSGIYFPQGGWVNPPLLCSDLINHHNITLLTNTHVTELQFDKHNQQWNLLDDHQHTIIQAPVVVIASNENAVTFEQTSHLPLKRIRGQVTHLHSNATSQPLKTIVCAERSLTPARNGIHSLGATFNLHEQTTDARAEDHHENIEALRVNFPDLYTHFAKQIGSLTGRVGFRTTTPDYMPIVGPVPIESHFIEDYAQLRNDSNARITKQGTYYHALFINTAHGSRGLLTCPLSAELLAAQISGEILPLPKEVAELLHPSRFVIKDLIKRKY